MAISSLGISLWNPGALVDNVPLASFDGEEWHRYFNVEIESPLLPDEFFSWWWKGLDAVDRFEGRPNPRRNCETHLDPIYRPQFINGNQPYKS